jgi:hypothetical protein
MSLGMSHGHEGVQVHLKFALPLVMGPSNCKCGKKRTELLSPMLRAKWSDDRGRKWDWYSNTQAYWFYCESCHMALWMADRRCRNGNSKPGPKLPTGSDAQAACKKLVDVW